MNVWPSHLTWHWPGGRESRLEPGADVTFQDLAFRTHSHQPVFTSFKIVLPAVHSVENIGLWETQLLLKLWQGQGSTEDLSVQWHQMSNAMARILHMCKKINHKCKMENNANSSDLHLPWGFKNKFLKSFLVKKDLKTSWNTQNLSTEEWAVHTEICPEHHLHLPQEAKCAADRTRQCSTTEPHSQPSLHLN